MINHLATTAPADRSQRRRSWLKAALVALFGALALAVLASQLAGGPEAVAVSPPDAAMPAPKPLQAMAGTAVVVHWQGDELVMALDGVPLTQAVAWLAQATHSTVTGAEWLAPVPVTLHHRGRDINAAWRLLLQGRADAALSCAASACRVWLSGPAEAPGAAARPAPPRRDAAPGAGPADAAPGENESQPGGSC